MSATAFTPFALGLVMAGAGALDAGAEIGDDRKARHARPKRRARMTSGTVDMPTASAPHYCAMRISAGVSKLGPENQT